MTRRLAALALAAVPAACLQIKAYEPQIEIKFTEDNTGSTATGTGFTLHFPPTGFHFPDQLLIDGHDVLASDPSAGCDGPSEAGLQLSPSYRISADSTATPMAIASNELHAVLGGPAVVQVELDWGMHLGATTRTPGGKSTFTVFLDGRIVRHDQLGDPGTLAIGASECQCPQNSGSNFEISSYWTFPRSFSALYTANPPSSSTLVQQSPTAQPEIDGDRFTCLDAGGAGYQVASAVRVPDSETRENLVALKIGDVFAFIHDFDFTPIDGSELGSFQWDNRSAVFIERGGCMAAFDRARNYLAPPSLTINQTSVPLSENDGIYGGAPSTGTGGPGFALSTDRAALTGPVPGGFAVWLTFPHAVELVRATSQGVAAPTGPWYIPQQVNSSSWIVWFRDPLVAGQTIVVAPN